MVSQDLTQEKETGFCFQNLGICSAQRGPIKGGWASDGPVLVLAGRNRKTRCSPLVAHILITKRHFLAKYWRNTTNKAAREMRERVNGLVGEVAESLWIGTFTPLQPVFFADMRRRSVLNLISLSWTQMTKSDSLNKSCRRKTSILHVGHRGACWA